MEGEVEYALGGWAELDGLGKRLDVPEEIWTQLAWIAARTTADRERIAQPIGDAPSSQEFQNHLERVASADDDRESTDGGEYCAMIGARWVVSVSNELLDCFAGDVDALGDYLGAIEIHASDDDLVRQLYEGGTSTLLALAAILAAGRRRKAFRGHPPPRPSTWPPSPPPPTPTSLGQKMNTNTVYHVAQKHVKQRDVLKGLGAFFAGGGRYNRVHQASVYLAEDPLVAISEAAYYQARRWHERIGGNLPIPGRAGELRSELRLWEINLDPIPKVAEVLGAESKRRFHPNVVEREVWNPGHEYHHLRDLADRIRLSVIGPGHSAHTPEAEGIRYPSVRTSVRADACMLFVSPVRGGIRGSVVDGWPLWLDFESVRGKRIVAGSQDPVTWSQAFFELGPTIAARSTFKDLPDLGLIPIPGSTGTGFPQSHRHRLPIRHV
jgi:hypothetical protein